MSNTKNTKNSTKNTTKYVDVYAEAQKLDSYKLNENEANAKSDILALLLAEKLIKAFDTNEDLFAVLDSDYKRSHTSDSNKVSSYRYLHIVSKAFKRANVLQFKFDSLKSDSFTAHCNASVKYADELIKAFTDCKNASVKNERNKNVRIKFHDIETLDELVKLLRIALAVTAKA